MDKKDQSTETTDTTPPAYSASLPERERTDVYINGKGGVTIEQWGNSDVQEANQLVALALEDVERVIEMLQAAYEVATEAKS